MKTKVMIQVKNVYGNELLYPANETAELFTKLLGTKTFSVSQLKLIQELGFEIEQAAPNFLKGLVG
jgi:hypothetical protein